MIATLHWTEMKTRSQMEYIVKAPVEEPDRLAVLADVALLREVFMVVYHEMISDETSKRIRHMGMKIYSGHSLTDIAQSCVDFSNTNKMIIMATVYRVHENPDASFNFEPLGMRIFGQS